MVASFYLSVPLLSSAPLPLVEMKMFFCVVAKTDFVLCGNCVRNKRMFLKFSQKMPIIFENASFFQNVHKWAKVFASAKTLVKFIRTYS